MSELDAHNDRHASSTEMPCDKCNQVFVCHVALKKHGVRVHGNALKCDICQRVFTKSGYYTRHLRYGHAEKKFSCRACSFATSERNQLRMHMEKRHLKKYTLHCKVCGKGFFEKSSLREHEHVHTGLTPYQCEACGMSFKLKCTLRAHKFRFHAHLFPHVCTICGKGLSTGEGLTAHMKLHAEDRKSMCEVCGRQLKTPRSLEEHLRLHTGERPYRCRLCTKAYPSQKHLLRHVKLMHSVQQPQPKYACLGCKKKYATSTTCYAHQKICPLAQLDSR